MLRSLSIRDFVIVDKLDLEFQPGFTVLTGETGAGKSILLDALGLALGMRAESGLVRKGAEALGGKGGGGRADMAQAGGPDGSKAEAALKAIEGALSERSPG